MLESQNHILLAHEQAWQVFLHEVRTFLGVDPTPSPEPETRPKRRIKELRVAQWGIAYLPAAWLLLQFIGEIKDPGGLPTWTVRAAQLTLLAGFVVTIIAAWVAGRKRRL